MNTISVTKEAQRSRLLNALREHGEISTLDSAIFSASIFTGQKNVLVVAG